MLKQNELSVLHINESELSTQNIHYLIIVATLKKCQKVL